MLGKAWWQGHEAAEHTVPKAGKQRADRSVAGSLNQRPVSPSQVLPPKGSPSF